MGNITSELDKELDLAVFTFAGDMGYGQILETIRGYYSGKLTKYAIWDFSGSAVLKLYFGSRVKELAKAGTEFFKAHPRPGGFDLIIVSDVLQYGLARMFASYAEITDQGLPTTKIMAFYSKEKALKWIRENEAAEKIK